MSEYDRWETRYRTDAYVFGVEPNEFLAASRPLLPKVGKALVVADGEARNGVWLAEHGLDVLSLDFSPAAQAKARKLARARNVEITLEQADVHNWSYPIATFDVACEVFAQFSSPAERAKKWRGMTDALKPNGLLIIVGYTPKQLEYNTGGPKNLGNLYTQQMLEDAFPDFHDRRFTEVEKELSEGASHVGMSAVIVMTARKNKH